MAARRHGPLGAVLSAQALQLVHPNYFDSLCDAMSLVAQKPNAIFMGQGVGNPGTTMSDTFRDVPAGQKLEMPVAEDMQMGMAIGMSLGGYLPVCVFPRWNFLICAANQLVNHLDRLPLYSNYKPKVIIRTAVPSKFPFNPGPQHDDDFSSAFSGMLRTVKVVKLHTAGCIVSAYAEALECEQSTILVEFTDSYKNARAR
jgi:pyruvate/2-oxoglutarate/acetoin dehydrogenase E1 component